MKASVSHGGFLAGHVTDGYSNSSSGLANPRLAARSDPQKCSVWGFTALHIAVEERGTQNKSNLKLKGCNLLDGFGNTQTAKRWTRSKQTMSNPHISGNYFSVLLGCFFCVCVCLSLSDSSKTMNYVLGMGIH